jgi:hypothetical protein
VDKTTMNTMVLMCLILLGSITFNTVMASVTVAVKGKQLVFAHEPRLVEVLAPIAHNDNWYWPSAALYQANDVQLEEMRQLLLNKLTNQIERYRAEEPETAKSLTQLHKTITSWRIARRLPIKIDYDLARIKTSANPRLPRGKYILELAPRMKTVQLFGAVKKTSNLPHLRHADVSKYIPHQTRTNLADKSYVVLIQADGREINAPVAYWNKAHQEAMPRSQIYVPFKTSLFNSEFTSINQQIKTLALHRVRQ